jgi:molybdopterin-guanine dinucleotide biosynthesis protein A
MGRDKAGMPAGDGTLVEHLAHRLSPVVDETIVAGASAALDFAGVRRIADRYPGLGPLAGIHAGLLAARHSLVWVVACDLPDVEPALGSLMRALADDGEAVVPILNGEPEGVCALYRGSLAPRVEALLISGELSVRGLLARCSVRYVTAEEVRAVDPGLHSFRNVNTPADYAEWLKTRSS